MSGRRTGRGPSRGLLPPGMLSVAAGVGVSGVSAYAFLALTARHFGPAQYAPLATFWSFTFLIGTGCFSTLEKEAGRLISGGLASGEQGGPVLRHAVVIGGVLTAGLIVIFAASSPVAVERLFAGNWILMTAFLMSLITICVQYVALGVLAGNSRFGSYGVLAGSEGVLRLLGAVALVALGARTLGGFALVVALAPIVAVLCVLPALRASSGTGIAPDLSVMSRSTAWLLVGTLCSSVLVGSGPITAQLLGGNGDRALTARLLSALVLVRVPLFLYTSGAATLLPALAGHLASGDGLAFRRALNRLVLVVTILGAICVGAVAIAGPQALQLVFGADYELPKPDLAILATAAGALLVATTLSIGLTAAGKAHRLALAWAIGVVVMVVVTAAVHPLLLRVEVGLLAGAVASALAMAPPLYGQVALGSRVGPQTLREAAVPGPLPPV